MTIDEAIRHCLEVAAQNEIEAKSMGYHFVGSQKAEAQNVHFECAADHRQLAEWLTELKEAKSIIRVCNRVLGFLLEHEIESTSTRHEVETLLESITEYLSGCGENGCL